MKEPIIKIIIIFAVMSACAVIAISFAGAKAGAPARVNVASNENFDVVFLFEIEGVKIYRFRDAGDYRYFSTGNGSFLPSMQTASNGKSYHSDGVENR